MLQHSLQHCHQVTSSTSISSHRQRFCILTLSVFLLEGGNPSRCPPAVGRLHNMISARVSGSAREAPEEESSRKKTNKSAQPIAHTLATESPAR